MALSLSLRQLHRWTSLLFTLSVIVNFAVMAVGTPPAWLTYSPLAPLLVLLLSGMYLFILPYRKKSIDN